MTSTIEGDAHQHYRELLDSLLEGFQLIAPDWTYLYVNPAAARHGQRTPEDLIGRRLTDMYPGIEQTEVFAALERCMIEREATSFENQFTFPDHTTRWFEIRVQPVPEGICVHSIDIQSRKEAETALREQESVAALGQMAAAIAHEVRNPLAGISGALQVLKERRAPGDPEVHVFAEMLQGIRSLDRLIRDLLVFAKPMRLEARPVSIADVVSEALVFLETDDQLRQHTVRLSVAAPSPVVSADRELLKNVFRNLFLNAAQAMDTPGAIDVRMECEGAACRVTVADTGPGVVPTDAGRVFEPFFSRRKGGTGLGLPLSRRIMRLHGGELALLAKAPPGATFLVTLPLYARGISGPRSEPLQAP